MTIHFVCSGNSFRSRIAEAYIKSLNIPGISAFSSGAHSYLDKNGMLSEHAEVVLKREGILQFASKQKTQTTQESLDKGDVTICVNRAVYRECLDQGLSMPGRIYIWDINDITHFTDEQLNQILNDQVPKEVDQIYDNICSHIDELVVFLRHPKPKEQIDLLDEDGLATGETSDITTIHEKGQWHNGVHIGLYARNGKVLVQQRLKNIIINPGKWDIGVGGAVAAGETPEAAIVREVKEELGISLNQSELQKIFIWKYNHHLPKYGFHDCTFNHTFIAEIPEKVHLKFQHSEVDNAKLIEISELRQMLINSSSNFININAYFNKILDNISDALKNQ